MRQITTLALAALALASSGAAWASPTYIYAGQLLAVPGEAPRGPTTVVVDDGKIVSVLDGFVPHPRARRPSTSRPAPCSPG